MNKLNISKKSIVTGLVLGLIVVAGSSVTMAQTQQFTSKYGYNMRNSPEVRQLQQFLKDYGYYAGPITGNYLSMTKNAVALFQKTNNVFPASGLFGPATRAVANALLAKSANISQVADNQASLPVVADSSVTMDQTQQFTSKYGYNMRNSVEVKKLQQFLKDYGYYAGPVTGNYLSLTKNAVAVFQKANNVNPASGLFGPATRAVANALLYKNAKNYKSSNLSKGSNNQASLPVVIPTSGSFETTEQTQIVQWYPDNYRPSDIGVNSIDKVSDNSAINNEQASLSLIAPTSGSFETGQTQTVKWSSNNYRLSDVNVNLIRKVSDNPVRYELVRTISNNTKNDGNATWVPAATDVGTDLSIEIGCNLSATACQASNSISSNLAVINSDRYSNTASAYQAIEAENNK